MMTIEIRYVDGCPNRRLAEELVREVLGDRPVRIVHRRIETPQEADATGFVGSPTLLIDGRDPFATGDEPVGLACRVYRTPAGPRGLPTREQLEEVLA